MPLPSATTRQRFKDAMERNLEWCDRWIKGRPGTQDRP